MSEISRIDDLVRKYNRPVPRYTSYPTVPFWKNDMSGSDWKLDFARVYESANHVDGISIYIHLPFCESLCTYCGCNKKITRDHSVENVYLEAIIKEWKLYRELMKQTPVIREIHLGGGTPTFFSPENLSRLIRAVTQRAIVHPTAEFSIEGHPNNTSRGHLSTLAQMGFKRVSFGVQDNDSEVQKIINRVQPFENVEAATKNARLFGFQSVNFDLIYGLPRQTLPGIKSTVEKILSLRPDRIAFYSYAHVPWTSRGQRLFDENDLPTADEKLQLYYAAKEIFLEHGYVDIGMDHFALPSDDLYKASLAGRLHRNFMGYTTKATGLLLGLGVSAISDLGVAFGQNEKTLHNYYQAIQNKMLPLAKGTRLTAEDKIIRKYILDISCAGQTQLDTNHLDLLSLYTIPKLQELAEDGLIGFDGQEVMLTEIGKSFMRNVCAAFDQYLPDNEQPGSAIFSKAV